LFSGWIKTFDEYFQAQTKHILVISKLLIKNANSVCKMQTEAYITIKKLITRFMIAVFQDNMVVKLEEHPEMKFIWAEVSYFAMWWGSQTLEQQLVVKKLLKNGQLEIVTGGWVMTDEANAYYYSILEQLILGHEWLKLNLDYKPK